ncbi:MAG: hypothetical protein R3C17_04635 [Planctomycetaceae bacterium]
MGDTPSLLHLLRGDTNNPQSPDWGGEYEMTSLGDNHWTDQPPESLVESGYAGAKTVNKWRQDYLRDWQQHMDWTLEK